MIRAWYYNVWSHRELLRKNSVGKREYLYYYCNLWCFITDQHLCRKGKNG